MLASPLLPTSSFAPQSLSEDPSQYRPVRDIEAFNSLLPPPIEFVEGSSSGAFAVVEGKYEPINVTPKATKLSARESIQASPVSPVKSQKPSHPPSVTPSKHASLYKGSLDLSWPQGYSIGCGLNNTGNTCFLNSALQCLIHTPPLLRVLSAHSKSDPCRVKNGFCMSCNLRAVTEDSFSKKHSFTPSLITSKLQLIAKHMRRGRQEDSHEFLRYAIDALQKSCLAGYPQKIDPRLAETTWVHKIFGGRLRSRVTCQQCNHNSDTFDSILDLSLDIYGASSLKEALRRFIAVDHLKGADRYKCEKCKKHVNAEKRFSIHDAPVVLTVHLKRFSPLGRKISHHIHYDERLSLQPLMSEDQYGPVYSLYGVICHAGGGPNSGHYFAHVKGASGQWFEMNDEMVARIGGAPVGMKNAYILFYIREKGQSLESVINQPESRSSLIFKPSVVAGMKKRKASDSVEEDESEDTGVKTTRPFIGPLLPPSSSAKFESDNPKKPVDLPDPQATLVKKKIQAASKKSTTALSILSQYDDDDDSADESREEGTKISGADGPAPSSSPAPPPPTSSPPASPIPASSFYGSSSQTSDTKHLNDKKRKSPDSDEREYIGRKSSQATQPSTSSLNVHRTQPKKSSFGGGAINPYNRLKGSNNLHLMWTDPRRRPTQYYSSKKRKILI